MLKTKGFYGVHFCNALTRLFPPVPGYTQALLPHPPASGRPGSGGKGKEPPFWLRGRGRYLRRQNLCVGALGVEGCMGCGKQCPVRPRGDDACRLCFFKRAADVDERFGERISRHRVKDECHLVIGDERAILVHPVHLPDAAHPQRVHLGRPKRPHAGRPDHMYAFFDRGEDLPVGNGAVPAQHPVDEANDICAVRDRGEDIAQFCRGRYTAARIFSAEGRSRLGPRKTIILGRFTLSPLRAGSIA